MKASNATRLCGEIFNDTPFVSGGILFVYYLLFYTFVRFFKYFIIT